VPAWREVFYLRSHTQQKQVINTNNSRLSSTEYRMIIICGLLVFFLFYAAIIKNNFFYLYTQCIIGILNLILIEFTKLTLI